MFLRTQLSDGCTVEVIVPRVTELKLHDTCFRGAERKVAGNFFHWESTHDLFNDPVVRTEFLTDVLSAADALGGRSSIKRRLTVAHPREVGWLSIDVQSNYGPDDIEFISSSPRSAMRIKPKINQPDAPRTNDVTFHYDLTFDRLRSWIAIIHDIYPGPGLGTNGRRKADLAGYVLFDWNHRGA